MRELKDKELMNVDGGAISFNGALLNSIARVLSTIMDIGRNLGSAITRISNGNYCTVKE